jgi:putative transposase
MLPMEFGFVEGVTHDHKRQGATALFAALHQEFLTFLREIDKAVPTDLDIQCIADNYATHNHTKIKTWLATRPRGHMNFIPPYSSWLNHVERFVALIPAIAIRRSSFTSVKQLAQRIDCFVSAHNTHCQPIQVDRHR